MSLNPTFPTAIHTAKTGRSVRRGDFARLALILMLFANVALGLMLAARAPDSALAATPAPTIQWHGNASGDALR